MRQFLQTNTRNEPATRSAAARALILALLAVLGACASAPEQETDPPATATTASTEAASTGALRCVREATVTVRVENRSSYDIQIRFGSYRPSRVALGFSRTTYQIARYHLERAVELVILRGGAQQGGPAVIPTEPIFCNVATLVIGASPEYSIFYGDFLREPIRGEVEEDGEEPEAEPADSTSTDPSS